MQVLYSPQRADEKIKYTFNGEVITATFRGKTDTFDFTNMPNGKAEEINTTLDVNPIVSAERKEGVLYVKLLNFIGLDATEEERFPNWKEIE